MRDEYKMTPAGIYISIPFCRQKCTFCNFASGVYSASVVSRYLDCLTTEITRHNELWEKAGIPRCEGAPVDSIYMGGGTPGILDPAQLADLIGSCRAMFHVEHSSEITIEAGPENVTPAAALGWAAAGINRVSLGVQSMVEAELRAVGRMHDDRTVAEAFASLRAAGIDNISVDLIAGLPHQTAAGWESSLQKLLALHPQHFSVYMLEVDEESRLGSELLKHGLHYHAEDVPPEDNIADFYVGAMDLLRAEGYEHYEISNFARPGKRSRHNQKYWTNAPYFGFGSDAHSYDGERRWANTDSVEDYCTKIESGAPAVVEQVTLSAREKLEERMFLGLRCRDGISFARLNAEFATEEAGDREPIIVAAKLWNNFHPVVHRQFAEPIREFTDAGWLESEGDRLRLTDRGVLFSNEVFAGFIEGK